MTEASVAESSGPQPVIPYLVVSGAAKAIEFYKAAFGAEELFRLPAPDGQRVLHAELKIGGGRVMLTDEYPEMGSTSPQTLGGTAVTMHLYVPDTDAAFATATAAGASAVMPPADMFWGDRFARVVDPFGHSWSIATHIRDVSPAEMAEGAKAVFGGG